MAEIRDQTVGEFLVEPAHVVRPDTTPVEIVLLIYRGQNNVPVVGADGRLVGMASARDILAAMNQ
jgi:CBS-domain-containing membrane protein